MKLGDTCTVRHESVRAMLMRRTKDGQHTMEALNFSRYSQTTEQAASNKDTPEYARSVSETDANTLESMHKHYYVGGDCGMSSEHTGC